jgi:predicted phage terminase large subunit-like protein
VLLSHKFEPFFELLSDDSELVEKHKDIRYVVLTGGRASGKSFVGSVWCSQATFKGWGILFTRYTMSAAYDSIIPEFREKTELLGKDGAYTFLQNSVVNNVTGAKISYRGLKPSSKTANSALKSVANKNVFILEEGEECADKDLFDKVNLSIRDKKKKNLVIIMLNPTHVEHWIYKTFVKTPRKDTMLIHTTYLDNYSNLNESFLQEAEWVKSQNVKRYRHQFLGEWQSDTDGALWRQKDIDQFRVDACPELEEIVVSWDPAGEDANKKGLSSSGNELDEDGIGVAGRSKDGHYYILRDETMFGKRTEVIKKVIDLYYKHDAKCIVVEKNQGCAFIRTLIHTVDKTVLVREVIARKGKQLRAQPVQSLYEQGLVHHVGILPELEHEMCTWVPDSDMRSPNRIDWMVWAITKLIKKRKWIIG